MIPEIPDKFRRYSKQIRFDGIGLDGQRKIAASRAVVGGCGALGSVAANLLARAGVGKLLILDRDFVERDNLQRQVLYDESDVGQPKAKVAEKKLRQVNSEIEIVGKIVDVDHRNVEQQILEPNRADVVIDGTDNFEIRFLINDVSVKHRLPWIYGGCLGAEGQVMSILPGTSACLNCLMLDGPPPPGTTATCDTGGILSTIIHAVAATQVNEALKILVGKHDSVNRNLQVFDLWNNRSHGMNLTALRDNVDCPTCKNGEYSWLAGKRGSHSAVLCGRNAVQVSFPDRTAIELNALAARLQQAGRVECNEFLVRLHLDSYVITTFEDGRAIINGTNDVAVAKKLYLQYIGA